jgi:hypothetical protein
MVLLGEAAIAKLRLTMPPIRLADLAFALFVLQSPLANAADSG